MEIRELDGTMYGALTSLHGILGELSKPQEYAISGDVHIAAGGHIEQDMELDGTVNGELAPLSGLNGKLTGSIGCAVNGHVDFGPTDYVAQVYNGEYTVDPSFYEQTLATSGKKMRGNVTVNAVSYSLATTSDINRMF